MASAIDNALKIAYDILTNLDDLHDMLLSQPTRDKIIILSPATQLIDLVGGEITLAEFIAELGYANIYIASTVGREEYTIKHDEMYSVIKFWCPPELPIGLRGGASVAIACIAYALDGHPQVKRYNKNDALAFMADLDSGALNVEQQMNLCTNMCRLINGDERVNAMIQRGHGRLAERHSMLTALVRPKDEYDAILVFPHSRYDDAINARAREIGADIAFAPKFEPDSAQIESDNTANQPDNPATVEPFSTASSTTEFAAVANNFAEAVARRTTFVPFDVRP